MCAGDVAGLIVGDEGVANGAGATAGAGFVVAEPPSRRSQAPLHGHGESYSDLILRLAELEGGLYRPDDPDVCFRPVTRKISVGNRPRRIDARRRIAPWLKALGQRRSSPTRGRRQGGEGFLRDLKAS